MKLVYTNANRLLVSNAYNILREEGVEVLLRNEFIGGAAGDLSPFDTWMEVWVKAEQHSRAATVLKDRLNNTGEADWNCFQCGEINAGSFELCWNCGNPRQIDNN